QEGRVSQVFEPGPSPWSIRAVRQNEGEAKQLRHDRVDGAIPDLIGATEGLHAETASRRVLPEGSVDSAVHLGELTTRPLVSLLTETGRPIDPHPVDGFTLTELAEGPSGEDLRDVWVDAMPLEHRPTGAL